VKALSIISLISLHLVAYLKAMAVPHEIILFLIININGLQQ
jgi:hypothetical protein